eukprot:gene21179-biopygen12800
MGICHRYPPAGRCVSLLKILLTNACIYDCLYCINRSSSHVPRARFSVEEVVRLTLGFYKRNYIEGLFLSSGIIKSSDYTMEELVRVARSLREEHHFRGYIHLKVIPNADPRLLEEAGLYADRVSVNVELPKPESLLRLAPRKEIGEIRKSMAQLRGLIEEKPRRKARSFAPAGQSTQMIVGADDADDAQILSTSANLYSGYQMRRVYYSAFSPIPDSSLALPMKAAPLVREAGDAGRIGAAPGGAGCVDRGECAVGGLEVRKVVHPAIDADDTLSRRGREGSHDPPRHGDIRVRRAEAGVDGCNLVGVDGKASGKAITPGEAAVGGKPLEIAIVGE